MEQPKAPPDPATPRGPRLVLVAIALILLPLLGASTFLIWRSLEWIPAEVAERQEAPPPYIPLPVLAEVSLSGVRAAILERAENAPMIAPGLYEEEVARWRELLSSHGATLTSPREADVIVLPYAYCMGAEAHTRVERHLERGGGIVTVGAVGSRNHHCHPAADTLLARLLARDRGAIAPIPERVGTESYYAVVRGGTALGANVPPGARIQLRPASHVVFRSPQREVYASNYGHTPLSAREERSFDGLVARARIGEGRIVAFGFALSHTADRWSEEIARLVAGNALTWAAGRPIVHVATWPGGARAAAILAQDVEDEYANAGPAADVLAEEGVPGTYFLVGSLAEEHTATTDKLARLGEIGTHTVDHQPLTAVSDRRQRRKLKESRQLTRTLTGHRVVGLRPPEEHFNEATLRSWLDLGGEYVAAANDNQSLAPSMIPVGSERIVLIARVGMDDYEALVRDGLSDPQAITEQFLHDFRESVALGGLYFFSYHSQLLARPELLPVLRALARAVRSEPGVWVASARDVARWWRSRHNVSVVPRGDAITVRNDGTDAFENGVLNLDLPSGERRTIELPTLGPGESFRFDPSA